jgi:hypothetical protein
MQVAIYDKFYPLKSHYLATRAPKQLIYNYIIVKTCKYGHLINKHHIKRSRNYIIIVT